MRIPRLFAVGLALSLLLALVVPAKAAIECRLTAVYDTNTNGATVMITGVAGKSIYICGYQLWSGGTVSVGFVRGTGTTCATGEVKITPSYALVAQTGVGDTSPVWRGLRAGPAEDVCIKTGAGVAVGGIIYYTQQ